LSGRWFRLSWRTGGPNGCLEPVLVLVLPENSAAVLRTRIEVSEPVLENRESPMSAEPEQNGGWDRGCRRDAFGVR